MTTFADLETSRDGGAPVNLYLFKGADPTLESLMRSVTLIPGAGEFCYGTTKVSRGDDPLNYLARLAGTDLVAALDDLEACAPNLKQVSIVVAWHGTDLRLSHCEIKPKVETASGGESPYTWQVGPLTRGSADIVSQISGKPAIGGAPSDRAVYEAIVHMKARGWKVTVYPFVMMDIATGNSLPNPYGGSGQPAYPWRGRITCNPAPGVGGTVDKTATAATQINSFFGAAAHTDFGWDGGAKHVTYSGPNEWSFRRFILHMATLANAAGADDFLLGSELVGMTSVRSDASTFPGVAKLITLAANVRSIVGGDMRISYGADWSEYHSYRPGDGSGDLYFNLDPLWSDANIDFIGIDNYLPISDWRDGITHLDRDSYATLYDKRYLWHNIEGGEYYDWYYASDSARNAQTRAPITDGGYNEPWVYRNKDFKSWWLNAHRNRPLGVRAGSATSWTPQSKPIVMTEVGFPAVNKATNQPNVFVDPKSSEDGVPWYSSGVQDVALQRTALEAILTYWRPESGNNPTSALYGKSMIEWDTITIWTWDARPFPAFPERNDFWGDSENYRLGHWINGRIEPGKAFDMGAIGPFAYTDAEVPIVRDGVTFEPIPIMRSNLTASGSLDKTAITVMMPQDTAVAELFKVYPPSTVINLFVIQGHISLDPDLHYKVAWTGRVLSCAKKSVEAQLTCEPISTSLRRNILRRNYQVGCPLVLYGPDCRASKKASTKEVAVTTVANGKITLPGGWPAGGFADTDYLRGLVEWLSPDGSAQVRSIRRITGGVELLLSGNTIGLEDGDTVKVTRGCSQDMPGCNKHSNIQNYGGQAFSPKTNPLKNVSIYY